MKKELDYGDYLLIKYKPYPDDRISQMIVKLTDTYITSINCLTAQPKWWSTEVIYSEFGIYKKGDKPCICMYYLDGLDYEIISEARALAMAI